MELLKDIYKQCLEQKDKPSAEMKNYVKQIYDRYTDAKIAQKIAELVYPKTVSWAGELEILYLEVNKMKAALKGHDGDWYFTGEYPTSGGLSVLNKAYINFYENKDGRAY
jgi:amidophosphoribosyltransferase